jgi:AraC family transcriptional activator of pyochelin receptor
MKDANPGVVMPLSTTDKWRSMADAPLRRRLDHRQGRALMATMKLHARDSDPGENGLAALRHAPVDQGEHDAQSFGMAMNAYAEPRKAGARRLPVRRYDYLPDRMRTVHYTGGSETYAAEPLDESPLASHIDAIIPLGHAWHYGLRFASAYATGRAEFCGLAEGFFVMMADCEFTQPVEVAVSAPDMLRIRISAKGAGEYIADHDEIAQFDGPSTLVVIEPAGAPQARCATEGPYRAAQLYIHRAALAKLYEGDEGDLPVVLQAFLSGGLQRPVVRQMPLTPALMRCLEDLLENQCEGRTRRHFVQSKTMEIFCHAFDALKHEDSFGSPDASMTTSRGVLKAQAILMEQFVAPPSLDHLAQEVGLSRTSLTAGFRRIIGQSVFDYIQDLRMNHALELLNEPGSTVTQVAYAVGYNHPSSFSVAVQRRFGASPSDLRRKCGGPVLASA